MARVTSCAAGRFALVRHHEQVRRADRAAARVAQLRKGDLPDALGATELDQLRTRSGFDRPLRDEIVAVAQAHEIARGRLHPEDHAVRRLVAPRGAIHAVPETDVACVVDEHDLVGCRHQEVSAPAERYRFRDQRPRACSGRVVPAIVVQAKVERHGVRRRSLATDLEEHVAALEREERRGEKTNEEDDENPESVHGEGSR